MTVALRIRTVRPAENDSFDSLIIIISLEINPIRRKSKRYCIYKL